jgi:hypothetical protein
LRSFVLFIFGYPATVPRIVLFNASTNVMRVKNKDLKRKDAKYENSMQEPLRWQTLQGLSTYRSIGNWRNDARPGNWPRLKSSCFDMYSKRSHVVGAQSVSKLWTGNKLYVRVGLLRQQMQSFNNIWIFGVNETTRRVDVKEDKPHTQRGTHSLLQEK